MMIDLSRFKVVYKERVLHALAIDDIEYAENDWPSTASNKTMFKPKFLTVLAINEDGNIVAFCDEAWMFQFLPICRKEN